MKNLFILFCQLFSAALFSQQVQAIPLNTYPLQADLYWGQNALSETIYSTQKTIYKNSNKQVFQYSNWALGNPYFVDILNPLKLLIFYKDFNILILLDTQLNEVQQVRLSEINPPLIVSYCATASGNQVWMYNQATQQIGLFNLQSAQWKNLGIPFQENCTIIGSDYNYIYFTNSAKQISRFSIYGKVEILGSAEDWDQVGMISKDEIIFSRNHIMFYKNLQSNEISEIKINEKTVDRFFYKDEILSIFTNQEITNYKITKY